jgi:glutamine synthetase
MFTTADETLKFIKQKNIDMVDLKVVGVAGQWLHITVPARQFTQKHFEEGVGYDGSSGAGFGKVESGDVAARPEPGSAFVDPFFQHPTLSFLCETVQADTKEPFRWDPRTIARRAVEYMRSTGVADEAWMAPEFEFHVFDRVAVVNTPYHTRVDIHSSETEPDGATAPINRRQGYLRVPPTEHLHDLRTEICLELERVGIPVRYHHHEVGAPGQCEIEVDLDPLLVAADRAMTIKYFIKNIARRRGKLATFMPKVVFGEAGNGMHVHQKLTKGGQHVFFDESRKNYADLSDLALHYVAGLLTHGRALTGITNPSTNSFKRLVEGYEAPVNLFFSLANRSAAIRVPRYAVSPEDKRIEYRPPDMTGNIYLTMAAMLMAGLDGIQSRIDPAANNLGPFDVDITKQDAEFRSKITPLPRSLYAALEALSRDRAFLLKGEVFSDSFIAGWIAAKRANDAAEIASRPHPHEYQLYLDV